MKIHRFIGDFDLSKNEVEIKNPENINQIKNVLRLKEGDKIILSDGKGAEAEVDLTFVSEEKIAGTIKKEPHSAKASRGEYRKVNLYLSILKKENFELAVQKAVEVGVATITPVITERTIKTGLNIPRLEKIILEASEQCGRTTLPELFDIFDFKEAINSQADEKIIFTPSLASDGVPLINTTYIPNKAANSVNIFIGPEGGFTEKEIELAKNSGYNLASLGPLTLRGETAAIVATYLAVNGI